MFREPLYSSLLQVQPEGMTMGPVPLPRMPVTTRITCLGSGIATKAFQNATGESWGLGWFGGPKTPR